jgi:hypothetical protein
MLARSAQKPAGGLAGKLNEWSVTYRLFVGYRYSEVRRAISGRAVAYAIAICGP